MSRAPDAPAAARPAGRRACWRCARLLPGLRRLRHRRTRSSPPRPPPRRPSAAAPAAPADLRRRHHLVRARARWRAATTCRRARRWPRSRSAAASSPGCRPTATCSAPATRSSGQIEGFDIDFVKAMAKAILGDENRYQLVVITAAQRIPALQSGQVDLVAREHDHDLRPVEADRLLLGVLPGRPEDHGPAGLEGHHARRPGRASGSARPMGTSSMDNLVRLQPEGRRGRLRQPHRVPGALPAGPGRRDHRRRHRARRPRRAGPVRGRPRAEGLHRRAVRAGDEREERRPGALRQRPARADARGRRVDDDLRPLVRRARSAPRPRPPKAVYGRSA